MAISADPQKNSLMPLWLQVLIGLILGVIAGLVLKEKAVHLKPLGTIFINLIKMVIVPLVFFSLVSAITGLAHSGSLSRIGLKSMALYLFTSLSSVLLGFLAAGVFKPGVGQSLHLTSTTTNFTPTVPPSIMEMLIGIVPDNAIGAMAQGHILQLVVFSLFTGFTLNAITEKVPHALSLIQELAQLFFKMIETIVRLAPIGVFGFVAWIVGTQGPEVLKALSKFMFLVIGACSVQFVLLGIMIFLFTRLSPMPFYRKMFEPQILAFSTTSSKAVLTTVMRVLNKDIGVSKGSTNFVLPLGAAMNMDGTAIYLSICGIFFAQMYGVTLEMHHYITLAFACTIASIGAAGIPSGSIVFMGMVLNSIGLPLEGIGLIIGVDRILDMFRTTINITGDAAITLIVDKSEGTMDIDRYYDKKKRSSATA
jgi:Na+/H+-dicarboxylate symporter